MSRVVARRRVAVVVAIANANSSEDGGGHGDDNLHDYLPHIDVNFAHDIIFFKVNVSSPAAALVLSADTACSGDTVASSSARAWWA